jgi:hypothetical protein
MLLCRSTGRQVMLRRIQNSAGFVGRIQPRFTSKTSFMTIVRPLLLAGALLCALAHTGCSIVTKVDSVPKGTYIDTIYIQANPKVHMKEFQNELASQLKGLGYSVESFEGERPKQARHMLTYTANWRWDMAMYLTYFQATLLEDNRVLGRIEYDANMGGARPDKFGRTADKIRPLLIDLLQNSQRREGAPPMRVSESTR